MLLVHQPHLDELIKTLADLGEQGTRGQRRHDVVGQLPTQLLDHLVAKGFGAFRVIGAKVDVHEAPAVGVGHFRTQAIHLVIVALHRHQGGVVDQGAEHLAQFQITGDEHTAIQARMGGDGCGGVGQVAGGGAAHRGEAQLAGAGEGHGHHPVLEGQRRHVDAVVLDVEIFDAKALGQVVGLEQGGEPGAHINGVAFDRQEIAVAPDRGGTGFDGGPAHPVPDRLVVVHDLERAEADVFADVTGASFIGMAAFLAAQAREGGARESGRHDHALEIERKLAAPLGAPAIPRCTRSGIDG